MNTLIFQKKITFQTGLLFIARGWSFLSVGILLLFFVGEGFNPSNIALKEYIGLLFFPFGVAVGLLIAWKKELLGGIISVVSLAAFYFIFSYLMNGRFPSGWAFIAISAPGFLFLLVGLIKKND